MSDSKLSFSKEIATTLGLEEAILLEYFKTTQEQQNPTSFNQICSDLTFWPSQKIKDLLNNLVKVGLVSEVLVDNSPYFSSKKFNEKVSSHGDNKWIPDKEVLDQIIEYGIPEDFANLQIDDFKKLRDEKNETISNW